MLFFLPRTLLLRAEFRPQTVSILLVEASNPKKNLAHQQKHLGNRSGFCPVKKLFQTSCSGEFSFSKTTVSLFPLQPPANENAPLRFFSNPVGSGFWHFLFCQKQTANNFVWKLLFWSFLGKNRKKDKLVELTMNTLTSENPINGLLFFFPPNLRFLSFFLFDVTKGQICCFGLRQDGRVLPTCKRKAEVNSSGSNKKKSLLPAPLFPNTQLSGF